MGAKAQSRRRWPQSGGGALTFSRAIGRFLLKFVMEAQPFGRTGVSESHPVG
jgi:hypothetical protein